MAYPVVYLLVVCRPFFEYFVEDLQLTGKVTIKLSLQNFVSQVSMKPVQNVSSPF